MNRVKRNHPTISLPTILKQQTPCLESNLAMTRMACDTLASQFPWCPSQQPGTVAGNCGAFNQRPERTHGEDVLCQVANGWTVFQLIQKKEPMKCT